MKSAALALFVLTLFFKNTFAAEITTGTEAAKSSEAEVEIAPNKEDTQVSTPTNDLEDFCFFAGTPPSDLKYKIIRKLKLGKGTYGGVKDILPKFAKKAKTLGADAIINYTGSQRFGFFPWRIVRPVVRGVAIKWSGQPNQNCSALGGTTLQTILATDRPPSE
jgi:hypothetical protein